jgi:hypothetical protein
MTTYQWFFSKKIWDSQKFHPKNWNISVPLLTFEAHNGEKTLFFGTWKYVSLKHFKINSQNHIPILNQTWLVLTKSPYKWSRVIFVMTFQTHITFLKTISFWKCLWYCYNLHYNHFNDANITWFEHVLVFQNSI